MSDNDKVTTTTDKKGRVIVHYPRQAPVARSEQGVVQGMSPKFRGTKA